MLILRNEPAQAVAAQEEEVSDMNLSFQNRRTRHLLEADEVRAGLYQHQTGLIVPSAAASLSLRPVVLDENDGLRERRKGQVP